MGKAARGGKLGDRDAPGPGQYNDNVSAFDRNKGVSIKGRGNTGHNAGDSPGPGQYTLDGYPTKEKAPAYHMGG